MQAGTGPKAPQFHYIGRRNKKFIGAHTNALSGGNRLKEFLWQVSRPPRGDATPSATKTDDLWFLDALMETVEAHTGTQ